MQTKGKKYMKNFFKKIKKIIKTCIFYIVSKKIIFVYNKKKYNKILNMKFFYLNCLKEINIEKFKEIKDKVENLNIDRIKKKNKIKIGFVLYTPSMWSCDKLYNMLNRNDKYELYIIICKINDGNKDSRKLNYESTKKFFNDNGFKNIIETENDSYLKKVNEMDIIIYTNPFNVIPKSLNIKMLPMNILTIYISYSFMLADRKEKFNLPMYQLTWKYFLDTLVYKQMMKKNCSTGDCNTIFCGYTRMDEFYKECTINEKKIWKIPKNHKNKVYKIIYAPHHSVFDEKAGFSTFDQNYMFMYELAKKYQNNTSWIVKPHPLLRGRITKNGFFKNAEDYDNYLNMWNDLPNAKVVTNGTYFDLFKTSDTIILDSISFLAEYQYVHKPLLLLTRETQKFNEFGDKLKKILYCAKGDDFDSIEDYLKRVVINENDDMKEKREDFFNKYLNYYDYNNKQLASEFIYNYLNNIFSESKGDKNEYE